MIPHSWNEKDRRLFFNIGSRKKSEHALSYCAIAIGCQLFYCITTNIDKEISSDNPSEDDAESTVSESIDVVAPQSEDSTGKN
jgi:hypothetical protein